MIRKAIQITLTVGLVLSLVGAGMVPASFACGRTCCMQSGMAGAQIGSGLNGVSDGVCCCCNPGEASRDFSQGCPLKMSDFPAVALSRAADDSSPTIAAAVTDPIDVAPVFSRGLAQAMRPVGAGPPLPIFLLNQSFLC